MTKKLTRQDIINWATGRGWNLDKYGHLQKEFTGKDGETKQYRYKLSKTAVRFEIRIHLDGGEYGKPSNEWARLRSGYYKDLSITEEGKLTGLKF